MSALLGTQPKFRQSPPIKFSSTRATRPPNAAVPAAATNPAVPAPMSLPSVAALVRFPELTALFVSTVRLASGLLLIFGALTPIACVILIGVMVMAVATTAVRTVKATSLLGWLSEFLYLPEVLLVVILLWLLLSGPGWFSVDHLILSNAPL